MADKNDEKESTEMEVEPVQEQDVLFKLADLKFKLTLAPELTSAAETKQTTKDLLALIEEHGMSVWYEQFANELNWTVDTAFLNKLKEANTKKLTELDAKIEENKKNAGDTEVRDAMYAKARYIGLTGDKAKAIEAYQLATEKSVGVGKKLEIVFDLIRIGMAGNDPKMTKENIDKAKKLVDEGADWERRNVLCVYEATYFASQREWKEAAPLFLKAVSTFSATELYSFETLALYTVISSTVSLDRPALREKVVTNPDILTVLRDIPHLQPFLFSLYECKYAKFFGALADLATELQKDRYLALHVGFFVREVRIVAYNQFLESYKSVTFASMAAAFGVDVAFLDRELSRFIAASRVNCKIDKVAGVIETNRPDARTIQYQDTLRHGDQLLNRVQKLSQVLAHVR